MAKLNESGAAHDLEDGISLQKQYRMERANRTVGQIVNASPDFHSSEDELSVGSGNALRSIEWDDENLKIERLKTVPLTSMDDTPDNINADMIPTLASLTHRTSESFLLSKTQKIEKDRDNQILT